MRCLSSSASITLFAAGAILAYYIFPHALQFLGKIGGPSLHQIYSPSNYLGLIVALMAVFGITFEFPVVLVSLELVGVLKPAKLASWRRWAIVLITAFAAIITPSGDPFSMLALALPLYVFYEVSILLGRLLLRRRTRAGVNLAADLTPPERAALLDRLGFVPDPFQFAAFDALDAGRSVLVSAPTGSGKTVVADYAIARARAAGARPSTRHRSRPCPTRSSPNWPPPTAPTASGCSRATCRTSPMPRSSS